MADPYIDQFETLIYGKFAREPMETVCRGKGPGPDPAIAFARSAQPPADRRMEEVLQRGPAEEPAVRAGDALEEARDVIVRFGSYLDSLKGRPVDPAIFFRGEAP